MSNRCRENNADRAWLPLALPALSIPVRNSIRDEDISGERPSRDGEKSFPRQHNAVRIYGP